MAGKKLLIKILLNKIKRYILKVFCSITKYLILRMREWFNFTLIIFVLFIMEKLHSQNDI